MLIKIRMVSLSMILLIIILFVLSGCVGGSYNVGKLIRTNDTGFIMFDRDVGRIEAIKKFSPNLHQKWQTNLLKSRHAGTTEKDTLFDLIESKDGGYIFPGRHSMEYGSATTTYHSWKSTPYVTKFDTNGNLVWRIDEKITGLYKCIGATEADGFLVGGSRHLYFSNQPTKHESIIVRYSNKGKLLWYLDLPTLSSFETAISTKNSVLFLGQEGSDHNLYIDGNLHAVMVASNKKILWEKVYEIGDSDAWKFINKAISTLDGGFVFSGSIGTMKKVSAYIVHIDFAGSLVWKTMLTCEKSDVPVVYDIKQLSDQGFLIVGTDAEGYPKGFIAKISSTGKLLWKKPTMGDDKQQCFQNIEINSDGTITLFGVDIYDENDETIKQIHSIQITESGEKIIVNGTKDL
ncbi:MAG: hypothetical protein K8R67_18340 [Desulfobacteraceae bacterium]|nr:hypothetical protein [Desulfobacteraceae bacterium]